jgi:hypothetical protein
MSGRTPVLDYQNQSGPNPAWDANFVAPWKIALATLLPTLVVLGLAWQVKPASKVLHFCAADPAYHEPLAGSVRQN